MRKIAPTPLTAYSPSDPRWELAQRVADAPNLRNCPKLRAFFLYVCENALLGRPENVREHLIGTRVFGRPEDYNLNEDNIVRVEARELRKRLENYFAGEGRHEPVTIDVPKGGYLPVFRVRQLPPPEPTGPAVAEAVLPAMSKASRTNRWMVGLAAGLVILSIAVVWLGTENWRLRQRRQSLTGARSGAFVEDSSFYGELLGTLGVAANRETLLVLSNPKVVLYYATDSKQPRFTMPGRSVPAPKELQGSFDDALNNIDRGLPFKFLHLTREDYTGMGEAVAAFHVGRLMQFLQRPVRLTQGRFLSWDHVQKGDLILLGGPQINDWTYQNVASPNFNFDADGIVNVKPLANEQKRYSPHTEPGSKPNSALTDYGVIEMLSSMHGFNMLLLAGCTSAGTAGVGEFFASPEKMRAVYSRIRAATSGKPFPANWEVLVQVNVRDALPVDTSAIAFRFTPAAH